MFRRLAVAALAVAALAAAGCGGSSTQFDSDPAVVEAHDVCERALHDQAARTALATWGVVGSEGCEEAVLPIVRERMAQR